MSFSILLCVSVILMFCWETWPAGRRGGGFEATIFTLVSGFLQLHSSTGTDPQIRKNQALSRDGV